MITTFAMIATIATFFGFTYFAIFMIWLMVLVSTFEFFTPTVPDEFSKVAAYSPIPRDRSSS
jgi:beta-lactamase regulating signal transducer with metallopeptidase domain